MDTTNAVELPSLAAILLTGVGSPAETVATVRAEYFEGQVDLKKFRATHPHHRVMFSDPLILEIEGGSYVVITKFGAVIFWNCREDVQKEVLAEIAALPNAGERNERVGDTVEVIIGAPQDKVTFSRIAVRELSVGKLKLISLALGQSVALEHFEQDVLIAMNQLRPVVRDLKGKGRMHMSENEVLQLVGFALDVRSNVLANLTLFDDPPETWESEALAHLDSVLYDHFDLEERLAAINKKVDFISDLNETLMALLSHRKSVRLEWIIIVLILIELILFIAQLAGWLKAAH